MCKTPSPAPPLRPTILLAVHDLGEGLLQLAAQREDEVQHGAAPIVDVPTQSLELLLQLDNAEVGGRGGGGGMLTIPVR